MAGRSIYVPMEKVSGRHAAAQTRECKICRCVWGHGQRFQAWSGIQRGRSASVEIHSRGAPDAHAVYRVALKEVTRGCTGWHTARHWPRRRLRSPGNRHPAGGSGWGWGRVVVRLLYPSPGANGPRTSSCLVLAGGYWGVLLLTPVPCPATGLFRPREGRERARGGAVGLRGRCSGCRTRFQGRGLLVLQPGNPATPGTVMGGFRALHGNGI